MRIAAIDIGTNSIHMVIAEASGPDGFDLVDREREAVQIGRGSFVTRRLRTEPVRSTIEALQRFVKLARRHQVDRILCTATAAVREARNGGEFVAAARAASGITPRVIPPAEEGRLIYLGVKSALSLDEQPSLIVDIGGGSAQLVVGNRERLLQVVSVPLGSLRLAETMIDTDPPSRRDLQRLRRLVRRTLREPMRGVLEHAPARIYGSSGAIHALAIAAHWMETGRPIEHLNGHELSLASIERVCRRLQRMTVAERERMPGIDAKRAEIIIPGAIVLIHILEEAGADAITLSDFGVREGLVTDYITFHAQEISAIGQADDLRLRSVLQCLSKFQVNSVHARHVAKLALELFDGFRSAHGLGADERELMRYAALLHDVGSVIGYDRHAEHSYYIIKNANLRAFTAGELEILANIARYHGKARPRKRDDEFRALRKRDRRTVRWLAALLRVAEGLDRSHYQLIRSLRVVKRDGRYAIRVTAKREAQLELWASRRRTDLLSDLLDAPVNIRPERAEPAQGARPARGRTAAASTPEAKRVATRAQVKPKVLRLPVPARARA
jgi:exopolyphosphatase / guanosine-5'-triphosphate,3'-diphosphate pyrophosphatase